MRPKYRKLPAWEARAHAVRVDCATAVMACGVGGEGDSPPSVKLRICCCCSRVKTDEWKSRKVWTVLPTG